MEISPKRLSDQAPKISIFWYNIANNISGDCILSKNKKMINKNKVPLENNLELERIDSETIDKKGYDFVPRSVHALSIQEQKLKTNEIEEITKDK